MYKSVWIISVYRSDKLDQVKEMFESIYSQSNKDFDIYVQEDGHVPEHLDQFLKGELEKGRIHYLGKREQNKGLAHSLNELIEKALKDGYTYFVRMDADDICIHTRFDKQLAFMEFHHEIDVVGSWIEEFTISSSETVDYQTAHKDIVNSFKKRCPMAHVTCFFRRSFFEKNGLYRINTVRNEDQALWIDGFTRGCIAHNIPEVLVRVRASDDYMARRATLSHALNVLKLKLEATFKLNFGFMGVTYAVALFGVMMAPLSLKRWLYKHFRKSDPLTL